MDKLEGTWYIKQTTFPMWLNEKKLAPSLNYTKQVNKYGDVILHDKVKYIEKIKGKDKSIEGFDYPDLTNDNAFIWRGNGILSMLESKWQVVIFNDDEIGNEWAVIWFAKTLFTPEGVDIISKNLIVSELFLEKIKENMKEYSILEPFVDKLQSTYNVPVPN